MPMAEKAPGPMANCPGCRKSGWPAPSGPKNCCPCKWPEKASPGRWPAPRGDALSVCTTSGARLGSLPSPTSLRPSSFRRVSGRSLSRFRRPNGPSPPLSAGSFTLSGLRRSRARSDSVKPGGLLPSRAGLWPSAGPARSSLSLSGSGSLSAAHDFSSPAGRENARGYRGPGRKRLGRPSWCLGRVWETWNSLLLGRPGRRLLDPRWATGSVARHLIQDPLFTVKEIGPCRVFFTVTESQSAKDLALSPAGSSGYQGPPITDKLLALPPCLKISLKLRKEPARALKRLSPPPSLNPGPTARPPTSGPVQAQGTRRCPGGGWRFPRRGRVARRGVRLGAVALRLAVLFVQTQRRQRQLLPGDEQRDWVRGERTTPHVLLPQAPAARRSPAPLTFSPACRSRCPGSP